MQWPLSMKWMLQHFRKRVKPDIRKKFQICVLVHATDRESAVSAIEDILETMRENRIGEGGSASFHHSLSYALVNAK
jgi:hypothetical protein